MPTLIVPAEHPSEFCRSPSLCPNLFRCDVPWRGLSAAPRVHCCLGMWSVEMMGIMGRLVWVPMLHYHKDSWHSCCYPVESIFFLFSTRAAELHLCATEMHVWLSISLWFSVLNGVEVCHYWGWNEWNWWGMRKSDVKRWQVAGGSRQVKWSCEKI